MTPETGWTPAPDAARGTGPVADAEGDVLAPVRGIGRGA